MLLTTKIGMNIFNKQQRGNESSVPFVPWHDVTTRSPRRPQHGPMMGRARATCPQHARRCVTTLPNIGWGGVQRCS